MSDNNFLAHFGVPGMKWGHRKASSVSSTSPKRTERHSDRKTVDELKRNGRKTLSNQEIESINKRLGLEKKLADLKKDDAQLTIKSGKNWVDLAVGIGGSVGALYGLSQTPLGKKVISGIATGLKE